MCSLLQSVLQRKPNVLLSLVDVKKRVWCMKLLD